MFVKHADGSVSQARGVGHYPGIAGYDDVEAVLKTASLVWDPIGLTWVKATQAGGVGGGGDASAANQLLGNASLASIDGKLTNPLPVSGAFFPATQPVSLADLDTRIVGRFKLHDGVDVALISAAGALSIVPLEEVAGVGIGAAADAEAAGNGSVIAVLKRLRTLLGGTGSIKLTDGVDTALVSAAGELSVVAANLDVALSTRLKPADTLAALTTLTQMNGQAITMGTGVRAAGTQRVTIATDDIVQVVGELAADAVDSGNPMKIGGIARSALTAVSAALDRVNAMFDAYGRFIIAKKDTWAIQQQPAVATQATIARASAGAGIKNVCTSITCTLSSIAAPTAGRAVFNLRDGATGAGTILWSGALSLPATAGLSAAPIVISDLWIEGSAATIMTLETAAAPAANIFATVAMTGTTTI